MERKVCTLVFSVDNQAQNIKTKGVSQFSYSDQRLILKQSQFGQLVVEEGSFTGDTAKNSQKYGCKFARPERAKP